MAPQHLHEGPGLSAVLQKLVSRCKACVYPAHRQRVATKGFNPSWWDDAGGVIAGTKGVLLRALSIGMAIKLRATPSRPFKPELLHSVAWHRHSSKGALQVLVARLRAKFRLRDIDLPLHTVRGTGYHFGAEVVIEED